MAADEVAVESGVWACCRRAAAELAEHGAAAVVLVGSHAMRTARPESDVDLVALGDGAHYELSVREGRLVSLSWRTEKEQRKSFYAPQSAILEVPAWRAAVLVHDEHGIAAALQAEARSFCWARIADAAALWVASELSGYAEEVHKLAAGLRSGMQRPAAIQRSLLAMRLPVIMAVHLGTLVASENDIWDVVAQSLGERWRALQDRALGLGGQSLPDSCRAALQMYCEAVALAGEALDQRQRAVADKAVQLAGEVLAECRMCR